MKKNEPDIIKLIEEKAKKLASSAANAAHDIAYDVEQSNR